MKERRWREGERETDRERRISELGGGGGKDSRFGGSKVEIPRYGWRERVGEVREKLREGVEEK